LKEASPPLDPTAGGEEKRKKITSRFIGKDDSLGPLRDLSSGKTKE
jgi:hypothetical protein